MRTVPAEELLQESAAYLELIVVAIAWSEAVEELGLSTFGETLQHEERLLALAQAISGYDPRLVITQNLHLLPEHLLDRVPALSTPVRPGAFNRNGEVVVAACPIERLEALARQIGQPALGHRCRKAYDSLVASTRRTSLNRDHVGRVLGAAYHDGRLSVYEVAEAMSLPVEDAIAFLDEHGFARDIDHVRLSDADRTRALEALRRDRLARGGRPPANAEQLAARNVIASQRIEGVDARRWLPPRS